MRLLAAHYDAIRKVDRNPKSSVSLSKASPKIVYLPKGTRLVSVVQGFS